MCRLTLKNRGETWIENPQENLLLRVDFASLPVVTPVFGLYGAGKQVSVLSLNPLIIREFRGAPYCEGTGLQAVRAADPDASIRHQPPEGLRLMQGQAVRAMQAGVRS